jgi:hypothetical protein
MSTRRVEAQSIDARGVGSEYRASALTDAKAVKSVVEKFRD